MYYVMLLKNYDDNVKLQNDLYSLELWSYGFWSSTQRNATKCPSDTPCRQLTILTDVKGVKKVEQVAEERDLGILITDDLKWSNQCNSAAAKAISVLGMIKRTFSVLNKEMFFHIGTQHIRPHLE